LEINTVRIFLSKQTSFLSYTPRFNATSTIMCTAKEWSSPTICSRDLLDSMHNHVDNAAIILYPLIVDYKG